MIFLSVQVELSLQLQVRGRSDLHLSSAAKPQVDCLSPAKMPTGEPVAAFLTSNCHLTQLAAAADPFSDPVPALPEKQKPMLEAVRDVVTVKSDAPRNKLGRSQTSTNPCVL